MSGPLRGSVTPTGKQQRSYDYPLTGAQQAAHAANNPSLSTPISIQPRSSPRGAAASVSAVNAGINMAQSCPTFSWQPPPAPSARPRLASVDPPPMELPPSPPVFSPIQAEAVKHGKKEESTSVALKKQIYSRSLSNYSSSAPTHVDYLSKFHPNLGQLDEAAGVDDDSDEEEQQHQQRYKPSARAVQTSMRSTGANLDDDSPLDEPSAGGVGIGIGQGLAMKGSSQAHSRVQQVQRQGDDFSLSKSPTIFSIMSTSQHNTGLHTADTSTSSSGAGSSPGHSILGSIAAGAETNSKRRSLTANKPPATQTQQATKPQADAAEDDLQFSISLTDEQEGEAEDASQQQDSLPLY